MKLHKYKLAASAYGLMLLLLIILLCRVDAVCKQQIDTLDQVMEIRQEIDEMSGQADTDAAEPAAFNGVVPSTSMTADEFDLICRVVAAEARGEGYDGQLAVAQVIRDRSQLWGMTPAEVVTADGQFAAPYQGEAPESVRAAVNDCLILDKSAFGERVTHFCEVSITPYWAEDKQVVGVIGNHRFYR